MTIDDYDMTPDECRPDPDCDDCGAFEAKKWDEDKEQWICPFCFPKEDEEDA